VTPKAYLAFDLGAESGRAVLAQLESGALRISEVHRFANTPIAERGSLRWNAEALWRDVREGLSRVHERHLDGIAVDTWGVDYALLNADGDLLQSPCHYRDARNAAAMAAALELVPRDEIYATTGVQFLPINTLYQLFAAKLHTPELLVAAAQFVMMPDLFTYWLTGTAACEYTDASTTQLIDPRTRSWATSLMERLGIPSRLAPPLVEPGSMVAPLRAGVLGDHARAPTPVIASASHDTAAAVAAITARDGTAFISSGTWSLIGTELDAPVLTPRAMQLNFSNEGGVARTTCLLKNVMGLWLLQRCRHQWARDGLELTYAGLADAAGREPGFRCLVDPDDGSFSNPEDMIDAIDRFCLKTDQPAPAGPAAYARTIFDSLALKYRLVIRDLEALIERPIERIRVIGGGSQNALLNQLTADATGVPVIAGPTEATALGNVAVQMIATGAAASLAEARATIDRSFPTTVFEPRDVESWDREATRFQQYCGLLYA
jgi:rhamnulokinase